MRTWTCSVIVAIVFLTGPAWAQQDNDAPCNALCQSWFKLNLRPSPASPDEKAEPLPVVTAPAEPSEAPATVTLQPQSTAQPESRFRPFPRVREEHSGRSRRAALRTVRLHALAERAVPAGWDGRPERDWRRARVHHGAPYRRPAEARMRLVPPDRNVPGRVAEPPTLPMPGYSTSVAAFATVTQIKVVPTTPPFVSLGSTPVDPVGTVERGSAPSDMPKTLPEADAKADPAAPAVPAPPAEPSFGTPPEAASETTASIPEAVDLPGKVAPSAESVAPIAAAQPAPANVTAATPDMVTAAMPDQDRPATLPLEPRQYGLGGVPPPDVLDAELKAAVAAVESRSASEAAAQKEAGADARDLTATIPAGSGTAEILAAEGPEIRHDHAPVVRPVDVTLPAPTAP